MSSAASKPKPTKTRRNPKLTRELILEYAGKLLAKDGPEGLSVSQVAQLAGVNRGTAYHHFQTREQLLDATKAWVSEKLCREVFGRLPDEEEVEAPDSRTVSANLINFAMENPEFGRVWLFDVLSSDQPASDPFWAMYKSNIDAFADSDKALPGIDKEVHAVSTLVSVFLWPVWARAHTHTAAGRRKMAKRFMDESIRQTLYGTLNKEKFPELVAANEEAQAKPAKPKSAPKAKKPAKTKAASK
ncbi:TetR/AcrR family transcriptional regulator [Pseudomaricurvus hydrocarbonicus]|uniref:TetR/AcrR family transcriptional regulator n=1 Tax=Pseudomaricurvus hydrocarbonicus TaxID=1470433 RepID=UPI001AA03587|nr:TetR/AcrR family transcriptional regulator [Aestuariicella hydrocarbonica]